MKVKLWTCGKGVENNGCLILKFLNYYHRCDSSSQSQICPGRALSAVSSTRVRVLIHCLLQNCTGANHVCKSTLQRLHAEHAARY